MECYRSDVEDTAYGAPDGTVILKGPKWPPLFPHLRCSSSSAIKTRSASSFFSSSNRPVLGKDLLGMASRKQLVQCTFLIAIARLLRVHYGSAHKIPDSPSSHERQVALRTRL